MDKNRAERKARVLNSMAKHPDTDYVAEQIESTRWENHRYGVHQRHKKNIVGVALT